MMVSEKRILKSKITRTELQTILDEKYPGRPLGVEETADSYIVRLIDGELDLDDDVLQAENYPSFWGTYAAVVTEISTTAKDERSVKVKRGQHEGWCFVSNLVDLTKLTVGGKALIVFEAGNRKNPVVIG